MLVEQKELKFYTVPEKTIEGLLLKIKPTNNSNYQPLQGA